MVRLVLVVLVVVLVLVLVVVLLVVVLVLLVVVILLVALVVLVLLVGYLAMDSGQWGRKKIDDGFGTQRKAWLGCSDWEGGASLVLWTAVVGGRSRVGRQSEPDVLAVDWGPSSATAAANWAPAVLVVEVLDLWWFATKARVDVEARVDVRLTAGSARAPFRDCGHCYLHHHSVQSPDLRDCGHRQLAPLKRPCNYSLEIVVFVVIALAQDGNNSSPMLMMMHDDDDDDDDDDEDEDDDDDNDDNDDN